MEDLVKGQVFKPYTEDQVLKHEAKVGGKRNLREIVLTDDENNEFVFLVKRPTRSVIQAITEANNKKDINGASKVLMGCVLEGEMEQLENDGAMYLAMLENITTLISGVKSDIKKL